MEAVAIEQDDAFAAGMIPSARANSIPAPESTHAVAAALAYARTVTESEVILIGLSGNGVLDLPAYASYV